jgi:hypothetical protein
MERGKQGHEHRGTGRQRDEQDEREREKASGQPRLVTTCGSMLGWLTSCGRASCQG